MTPIKFGTDGWRAIIAKEYTVENVKRVAAGTATFAKEEGLEGVVIGYDCRFGGLMFAEATTAVLGNMGVKVYLDKHFATTPMVSLGVTELNAGLGVVITASHNPPSYNGYKLKSKFGGPSIPSEISRVEAAIPPKAPETAKSLKELEAEGLLEYVDLTQMYFDRVMESFDILAIRDSGIGIAYDAMYGAGQDVMKKILPDAFFLHCDFNPSFKGQAPEPIDRNLSELAEVIKGDPNIHVGVANDGDADRIGMYDENGNFVDSHHLLLLLLYYLREYKDFGGKVAVSFSVTDKMQKLTEQYGLDFEVTKIGFKYIAEIMRHEKLIVGGEESGGLTVAGHIPERDGIWTALLILELMSKTGKKLTELMEVIDQKVGPFAFDRDDLHLPEDKKAAVIERCANGDVKKLGVYDIDRVEDLDGYKFFLGDGRWVMVRPSGTEPLLRVYAQAENPDMVRKILDEAHAELLS